MIVPDGPARALTCNSCRRVFRAWWGMQREIEMAGECGWGAMKSGGAGSLEDPPREGDPFVPGLRPRLSLGLLELAATAVQRAGNSRGSVPPRLWVPRAAGRAAGPRGRGSHGAAVGRRRRPLPWALGRCPGWGSGSRAPGGCTEGQRCADRASNWPTWRPGAGYRWGAAGHNFPASGTHLRLCAPCRASSMRPCSAGPTK